MPRFFKSVLFLMLGFQAFMGLSPQLLAQGMSGQNNTNILIKPPPPQIPNIDKVPVANSSEPSEEECEQLFQRRRANQEAFKNAGIYAGNVSLEEIQIGPREQICIDREAGRQLARERTAQCADLESRTRGAHQLIGELRQQAQGELSRLQTRRMEIEGVRHSNRQEGILNTYVQSSLLTTLQGQIRILENRLQSNCIDSSMCDFFIRSLEDYSTTCGKTPFDEGFLNTCRGCLASQDPRCNKR